MNCVSIAIYPRQAKATIRRVIEYFCPDDRQGSRIWVDIFVENRFSRDLTLRILHAGSLEAKDVSEDSWGRANPLKDNCASVLTARIKELHKEYFPIEINYNEHLVQFGEEEYQIWSGSAERIIGGSPSVDVPFTLWELQGIVPGKSLLRLCLEMNPPTYRRRFADKRSFFAYGEAIVLRNIEDGALPAYKGVDAETYRDEFANFKGAHKAPEAFEYLIVSPEREKLAWDAIPLSTLISPKYIRSPELAKTTRWFTAENQDNWELQANVLEIIRTDNIQPLEGIAAEFTAPAVGAG